MIGYYVHHQGAGHLATAMSFAAASAEPVVGLSSLSPPPAPSPFADWVTLSRDDGDASARDHTAGGALHWAPRTAAGFSRRMRELSGWIARAAPRALVVDVSVEVTVLGRLLGVPTVVVALPGHREDTAHTLGFRAAAVIIAPWPREVYRPAYLEPFRDKVHHCGAFSRFDGRAIVPGPGARRVLVLGGHGGWQIGAEHLAAARAGTPGWQWVAACGDIGPGHIWSLLVDADVVVTHAGRNAVAEIAAARRPAVVVPQDRPFGEQSEVAEAIGAAGLAIVAGNWPSAKRWPQLLEHALNHDVQRWACWSPGDGAARAAAVVEAVASGA